jgi:hypothetical protein
MALTERVHTIVAAPAGNGGNGMLFNYASIKANLVQWFIIGCIIAGCAILFAGRQRNGNRLASALVAVLVAGFVAFAPWQQIASWVATNWIAKV